MKDTSKSIKFDISFCYENSNLTFLSYMGLSYNNFTRRMPSGSQAWHPTFCKSVNVYWPSAGGLLFQRIVEKKWCIKEGHTEINEEGLFHSRMVGELLTFTCLTMYL
jgi:hypothetical protein